MGEQVRDEIGVRGGELQGDDATATAGEEVELLVAESESIGNSEGIASLLGGVEV